MSRPLRDLFSGMLARRPAYQAIEPRWTFERVILPEATRRMLSQALGQIQQHDLIFRQWGLGERHTTGVGLAFNFAGPPGTGKSICAEAIAHELRRPLLLVRYADLQSMWAGETSKNLRAVFEAAQEQNAVLFFDEADAIASRRFAAANEAYAREANLVVNVLLNELEAFNGVIIFATNIARNFDPAFERRIRTHIYFELPGVDERERIWRAQLHEHKTPLAADVDFRSLAERYERSGGDIKNAVLKAALAAADEPGPDNRKQIRQEQFERGMQDVIAANKVLQQSSLDDGNAPDAVFARLEQRQLDQQEALHGALQEISRPLRLALALGALAVAIAIGALLVAVV